MLILTVIGIGTKGIYINDQVTNKNFYIKKFIKGVITIDTENMDIVSASYIASSLFYQGSEMSVVFAQFPNEKVEKVIYTVNGVNLEVTNENCGINKIIEQYFSKISAS